MFKRKETIDASCYCLEVGAENKAIKAIEKTFRNKKEYNISRLNMELIELKQELKRWQETNNKTMIEVIKEDIKSKENKLKSFNKKELNLIQRVIKKIFNL